jgi:hypothetical protein
MKQLLRKAAILGSTLALSLVLAAPAMAQTGSEFDAKDVGTNTGNPILLQSEFGFKNLSQAINTIITAVIFFGALVAFVFIVIGAFRYVSAGDDAAGTKAARTIITLGISIRHLPNCHPISSRTKRHCSTNLIALMWLNSKQEHLLRRVFLLV